MSWLLGPFDFGSARRLKNVLTCLGLNIRYWTSPDLKAMRWLRIGRNKTFRKHHRDFIIYIVWLAIFHPHFVIRIFPSAFCHPHFPSTFYHPHFSIRIVSPTFFHPYFIIRIFPSVFYHLHFSIRHPPSAIRHPPSAPHFKARTGWRRPDDRMQMQRCGW